METIEKRWILKIIFYFIKVFKEWQRLTYGCKDRLKIRLILLCSGWKEFQNNSTQE